MPDKNPEEIRQIMSILNYKVILYSLLLYRTKCISQMYNDITNTIQQIDDILEFDQDVGYDVIFSIDITLLGDNSWYSHHYLQFGKHNSTNS